MLCSSDPAITTAVRRPSLIDKIIIFGNERKFVRRILDCCVPPTHTPVQRAPTAPIAMRRSSLLLWHERQTHAAQQPIYRSGKMCWCWVCVRRICRVALPYIRKQQNKQLQSHIRQTARSISVCATCVWNFYLNHNL